MFTDVKEKLKELGISPIFFVGSGLSRRYISSPDWLGLLKEVMESTSINFTRYKQKHTYKNEITNEDEINLENLAQELEDVYFDNMPEEEIEDDGNKGYYYRKNVAKIISKYLNDKKEVLQDNTEVKELKKTSPSAIITTNYDNMLEEIFGEEYTVHVGQNSLLTSVLDGVGEIYKIHGCIKDINSIVITKNDYDKFFKKDIYLNAKLLTLFLEYPIVFLGYSISDRNVKSILSSIVKMLPYEKVEELKKRIWFIKRSKNGVDKTSVERIPLDDGLYIDIQSYELSNYGDFYKVISDVRIKKLPIKFLKYLKNNTYNLIASQEYNPKLLNVNIQEIEGIKNFNEGNNFVGLTFSTIERKVFSSSSQVIDAFIGNDNSYDAISIIGAMNELLGYTPFYKFIKTLDVHSILSEIEKRFGSNHRLYRKILNDDTNYVVNLGTPKDGFNYSAEIDTKKINEYIEEYTNVNGFNLSNSNVIKRYFMLYLLNNRFDELLINDDVVKDFKEEITKAATNLSEVYIRQMENQMFELIKKLYNANNTTEFKKLLCLVDRALYRREIKGIQ